MISYGKSEVQQIKESKARMMKCGLSVRETKSTEGGENRPEA